MIRSLLLALALLVSPAFLRAEDAPIPEEKPPVVLAADKEAVAALAGKRATVEGKVTRVGSTAAGGITFINFAGGPGGFVAVVYKSDYAAFPEGFDKYKGQTVRVTGPVVIYKETTPQIAVKSAEQIEILPATATGADQPAGN